MIKESLEQVDWDNPRSTWGANDQENWENEQSAMPFDKKLGMTTALFNVINEFLGGEGRELVRVPQSKLDNLLLQIIELSQPKQ